MFCTSSVALSFSPLVYVSYIVSHSDMDKKYKQNIVIN